MNTPHVRTSPLQRLVSAGAVALVLVFIAGCDSIFGPGDSGPPVAITELPRELTATEVELLSSSNRFGMALLAEVLEEEPDATHFLSPLSAAMVLVVIMNGAEGETYDAIRETLRLDDVPESEINAAYADLIALLGSVDPAVSFQLGNGIWYREGVVALHDEYVDRVEEHFGASVEGLDFDDPASVSLPRFELEWEKGLNDPLTAMGMGPAFGFDSDWSRMFEGGSPQLGEVFQKSYVRVDEEGTEAAAATGAVFDRSGPFEVRADRPFLFVIRERLSGAALFVGAYMAPPE